MPVATCWCPMVLVLTGTLDPAAPIGAVAPYTRGNKGSTRLNGRQGTVTVYVTEHEAPADADGAFVWAARPGSFKHWSGGVNGALRGPETARS